MKQSLRITLYAIYFLSFLIPGFTFFVLNHEGNKLLYEQSIDLSTRFLIVFRLFGLYAFHLVWSQIMLGSFRLPLTKLYGSKILRYHIVLGIFTLFFTLSHLGLFSLSYSLQGRHMWPHDIFKDYLGPLWLYGVLGEIALAIMIATVLTGYFRNHPLLQKHWRKIHYMNYVVFVLAFIHSFKIGAEVGMTPMRILYAFYAVTFIAGLTYKRIVPWWKKIFPQTKQINTSTWEIKEGKQ